MVTETAERGDEIDIERAEAKKARVLESLAGLNPVEDRERIARLEAALRRAELRIRIAQAR